MEFARTKYTWPSKQSKELFHNSSHFMNGLIRLSKMASKTYQARILVTIITLVYFCLFHLLIQWSSLASSKISPWKYYQENLRPLKSMQGHQRRLSGVTGLIRINDIYVASTDEERGWNIGGFEDRPSEMRGWGTYWEVGYRYSRGAAFHRALTCWRLSNIDLYYWAYVHTDLLWAIYFPNQTWEASGR